MGKAYTQYALHTGTDDAAVGEMLALRSTGAIQFDQISLFVSGTDTFAGVLQTSLDGTTWFDTTTALTEANFGDVVTVSTGGAAYARVNVSAVGSGSVSITAVAWAV